MSTENIHELASAMLEHELRLVFEKAKRFDEASQRLAVRTALVRDFNHDLKKLDVDLTEIFMFANSPFVGPSAEHLQEPQDG